EAVGTASAPPSLAEQRLSGGTRFYGTVSDAHGAPPVHDGAPCELGAVPVVGGAGECRIFLECGGYVLHGQPIRHTVPCSITNGQVDGLRDPLTSARDVDAAVELVPGRGVIEVRDESPGEYGRYTMRITIDSVEPGRH
ncbi:MAG: hypothetical protein K1X89_28985, partial [Myxococcaceae bacterium]|nr:hypothetical protein [Myxococcaceae bacterium]